MSALHIAQIYLMLGVLLWLSIGGWSFSNEYRQERGMTRWLMLTCVAGVVLGWPVIAIIAAFGKRS